MPRNYIQQLIALCISTMMLTSSLVAQLSKGDKVEFEFRGRVLSGTVVDTFGRPRVRFNENGRERTESIAADDIIRVGDESNKPKEKGRVWTDSSRQFKVFAALVEQTETHVSLQKKDGLIKSVPINILSQQDREYLVALKNANNIPPDSPFFGGDDVNPDPPTKAFDRAQSIKLAAADWTYQPVARNAPATQVKEVFIAAGGFASGARFKVSQNRKFALIGAENHGRRGYTTLNVADLAAGESLASHDIEGDGVFIGDVDNQGNVVIGPGAFSRENNTTVRVIDLQGNTLFRWTPSARHSRTRIKGVRFLDDKHLVVQEDDGRLVVWNWRNKTVLYTVEGDRFHQSLPIACSPNNQAFLGATRDGLFLIESMTGKVLGKLDSPRSAHVEKFAFSPDGTRLAGISRQTERSTILIWDLTTGDVKATSAVSTRRSVTGLAWAGNDLLFIGDALLDLKLELVVWRYEANGVKADVKQINDKEMVAFVSGRGGYRLFPFAAYSNRLLEQTKGLDRQQLFSLKPGMSVKLEEDLHLLKAEERDKVIGDLEGMLTRSGLKISNDSNVVIKASVKKMPGKDMVLRDIYRGSTRETPPGPDEDHTYHVSPHAHSVSIEVDGDMIFSVDRTYEFRSQVRLQGSQTVEDFINLASGPQFRFFSNAIRQLPIGFTLLPGNKLELGTTTITEQGVTEAFAGEPGNSIPSEE